VTLTRTHFLISGAATVAATLARPLGALATPPARIGIDYAYYNPPSLILKQNGWLEEALRARGIGVDWVLSLGSNKANGFLAANAVQFGSTAGSAALLARANGTPIKTIFLYSRPEWTALVVAHDSPLKNVRDLKGKRVAATRGTDPYFFLLRSLRKFGLDVGDIELVDLQHPDGRTALERGQVDAWAGLDPHMAASQLEAGSRLIYRNVEFNTFGALNAREDFLAAQPDLVAIVLAQYERARAYAIKHPDQTAAILASASHLQERVAALEIRERTTYPDPAPGAAYAAAIDAVVPIIVGENLVAAGTDVRGAAASLAEPRFARVAARA
jgi:sulfonate transport system substrate-binding protein